MIYELISFIRKHAIHSTNPCSAIHCTSTILLTILNKPVLTSPILGLGFLNVWCQGFVNVRHSSTLFNNKFKNHWLIIIPASKELNLKVNPFHYYYQIQKSSAHNQTKTCTCTKKHSQKSRVLACVKSRHRYHTSTLFNSEFRNNLLIVLYNTSRVNPNYQFPC